MNNLVKIENGVPTQYSYSKLKKDNPNTSFPKEPTDALLASYNVKTYTAETRPDVDSDLKNVTKGSFTQVGGEWVQGWSVQDITPTNDMVKAERDRRLDQDFVFNGKTFQRDPTSIARISGAGTLALGAIVGGAQVGDTKWHGRDTPFVWIASDDTLMVMDAQTCFAFGQAAAARETELVFAAKALRAMSPIPSDYKDDKYWS